MTNKNLYEATKDELFSIKKNIPDAGQIPSYDTDFKEIQNHVSKALELISQLQKNASEEQVKSVAKGVETEDIDKALSEIEKIAKDKMQSGEADDRAEAISKATKENPDLWVKYRRAKKQRNARYDRRNRVERAKSQES